MITLLTGENNFDIRAYRARMIAAFRKDHGQDGATVVDGADIGKNDLPQLLHGASLFAPKRLIVIDNASAQKDIWEAIGEYVADMPETTRVLLVAPSADKRTKTYKTLVKIAEVKESKLFSEGELAQWLKTEARNQGLELPDNIARYMIEYVGPDQSRLAHDIEKLVLSQATITPDLIRELLIPSPQASAFELLDAVLSGHHKKIDELLNGVRAQEDPYRFFGLLSNQVYAVLVVAAAGSRSPDEIARASGLHPFVVRKTGNIAKTLSAHKRHHLAEVLATCDRQLKSSGADPWVLITAAIKNIAA